MNKVRALGLAVLAIGAMSIVAVPGARANSEFHVTNRQSDVIVTGEQHAEQLVLELTGVLFGEDLEIRCSTATFEGTPTVQVNQQTKQVTFNELTLTPNYTGIDLKEGKPQFTPCQVQGAFNTSATIDMNGCRYTLTSNATALTSTLDIVGCTANKKIQITTGEGCTIDVGEQSSIGGHITATNITEEVEGVETHAVTDHVTLEGITYQPTGALCILGQTQRTNGDYFGTAIFRAYEDLGLGLQDTINGHQFTTLKCGQKLQLYAT